MQMKYMLLLNYLDVPALSGTEPQPWYLESTELAQPRNSSDPYPATRNLLPTTMIASVSGRNGKGLVTDGPFAETHELMGG